jgi:hypothetical protein
LDPLDDVAERLALLAFADDELRRLPQVLPQRRGPRFERDLGDLQVEPVLERSSADRDGLRCVAQVRILADEILRLPRSTFGRRGRGCFGRRRLGFPPARCRLFEGFRNYRLARAAAVDRLAWDPSDGGAFQGN